MKALSEIESKEPIADFVSRVPHSAGWLATGIFLALAPIAAASDFNSATLYGPRCDSGFDRDARSEAQLPLGTLLVAAGCNTAVSTGDDIVVDGRIITAEDHPMVTVHLLTSESAPTDHAQTRLGFSHVPGAVVQTAVFETRSGLDSSGTSSTDMQALETRLIVQRRLGSSWYAVNVDLPGQSTAVYGAFRGGVRIAAGDLDGGALPVCVERLPDKVEVRGGPQVRVFDGQTPALTWVLHYDAPVRIQYFNGRLLTAQDLEASQAVDSPSATNNLRQMQLLSYSVSAQGTERMQLTAETR